MKISVIKIVDGRSFWSGAKKLFTLLIGTSMMFLTLAPNVWAEEQVVTIYFGGTGLPSTWWEAEPSRFKQPHLLALLYHFQIANPHDDEPYEGDENQHKWWVNGVGASPCKGNPLVLGSEKQRQQKEPHDDICWNWEDTLIDGMDYLTDRLIDLDEDDWMTVNVLGNSRGAMTSMWFLERLVKVLDPGPDPRITKINIIAIDPVPGVKMLANDYYNLEHMDISFNLNERLSKYVGIYAQDERSVWFGALVPAINKSTTETMMFRVRGSHETLVGNRQINGHSVAGGILNESPESTFLKSVNDIVAVTAIELLTASGWGKAQFDPILINDYGIYPYGREEDDDELIKDAFFEHIQTMNNVESLDPDVRWAYIRDRSFFGGFQSFFDTAIVGKDCHWSLVTGSGFEDEPRCMLRICPCQGFEFKNGKRGMDSLVDIHLIGDGLSETDAWKRIKEMGISDIDKDGVADEIDNCKYTFNPEQTNSDDDDTGDACDAVADANGPYVEECTGYEGADVQLDGSGSFDPDGELVAYDWQTGDQTSQEISPLFTLEVGQHEVELMVQDNDGNVDTDHTAAWVLDSVAPDLTCPPNFEGIECTGPDGASVSFEATATDLCDDDLAPVCKPASGSTFPIGVSTPLCMVSDDSRNGSQCEFTIEIVDSVPPVITGITEPIVMWEPSHDYVTYTIRDFVSTVEDTCTVLSLDDLVISQVTSSEADDETGDGNTENDFVIATHGKSVDLRMEREGRGTGRTYTIFIQATDGSGNVATAPFYVEIKDNNSK